MKNWLIAMICLGCSLNVSAQKIHYTDTSNVWSMVQPQSDMPFGWLFYYTHYSFVARTVIDSVEYVNFGFGKVREDTVLNKVYLRSGDTEKVLMDYNLRVGDTFYAANQNFVVVGMDSTLINSVWHKVWYFPFYRGGWYSTGGFITVIEGIGCIQAPLFMFSHHDYDGCVECAEPMVYCFANNGIRPLFSPAVRWLNNTTSCRDYPHLDAELFPNISKGIHLFPNPAYEQLVITSSEKIYTLSICDVLGKIIHTEASDANRAELQIAHLPAGVYYLKVNNSEVKMFVKD